MLQLAQLLPTVLHHLGVYYIIANDMGANSHSGWIIQSFRSYNPIVKVVIVEMDYYY